MQRTALALTADPKVEYSVQGSPLPTLYHTEHPPAMVKIKGLHAVSIGGGHARIRVYVLCV